MSVELNSMLIVNGRQIVNEADAEVIRALLRDNERQAEALRMIRGEVNWSWGRQFKAHRGAMARIAAIVDTVSKSG